MFIAICVVVNVKVNLDNQRSLDVVHRLFESVSSSVFRPVDIVLKTLFIDSSSVVSMLTASLKFLDVAEAQKPAIVLPHFPNQPINKEAMCVCGR